jgi:hypothetical protein
VALKRSERDHAHVVGLHRGYHHGWEKATRAERARVVGILRRLMHAYDDELETRALDALRWAMHEIEGAKTS